MKKGDIVELKIEKYGFEGKGIAKVNKSYIVPGAEDTGTPNYVVFANGSYPGDTVKARLRKIKTSYAEAQVTEVVVASEYRKDPMCKYFGVCGGCKQQNMDYPVQTMYKQQQVKEIFEKMGGFKDFIMEDIIPSDKIFHYRNKMEFSFTEKRWLTSEEITLEEIEDKNFALGFHVPNVYDKVVNIHQCFLQTETSDKIVNFTRDFFKSRNISIYTTRTHEGYLRNLVIKNAHHTPDLMVNLVTAYEDDELVSLYTAELLKEVPEVTTVINNINKKKSSVAVGDYEKVFFGSGYIHDTIGGYRFRISANSFFQTNTLQAEKLYATALEFAQLTGNETVYDLYSGAGTISIYVSGKAKEVYAFETVESSVADAGDNAKRNNISNVHFITADLYKSFLPAVTEQNILAPDVMIIDPPRNGMHPTTVNDVISLGAKRLVYVSCNPATQVRDIRLLTEAGYKLIKLRPVDMFPHTYHIENVALLEMQ